MKIEDTSRNNEPHVLVNKKSKMIRDQKRNCKDNIKMSEREVNYYLIR